MVERYINGYLQREKRMRAKLLQAIELLASGKRIEECALVIGVSRRTVHNWLNDPEFLSALDTRKSENVSALNDRLINLNDKALDVLEECMNSRNEQARLRSASIVIGKYHEALEASEIKAQIERINKRLDRMASTRKR